MFKFLKPSSTLAVALATCLLFSGCFSSGAKPLPSEISSSVSSETSSSDADSSSGSSSAASDVSSAASSIASAISGSVAASSSAASSAASSSASSAPTPWKAPAASSSGSAAPSTSETPSQPSSTPPSQAPSKPDYNPAPAPGHTPRGEYVVGYYASWARGQGFKPSDLDASLLTHIHYAFADINSKHQLVLPNGSTDRNNLADLRKLKKQNSELKLIISVGGWDYSKNFSNAAATASSRAAFAQSCVDFILEHGLDGVDLDWEFPVSGGIAGNSNRPEDKQNYTKLLKEIRSKLNAQSQRDGRPYYLSIAGAPDSTFLNKIEPSSIASVVDYIFLMGYDMHGPWDRYADFNAPLYIPNGSSPQYANSVDTSINAYLKRGVSASKLVLGMPFYGYRYEVTNPTEDGLYSRFSSAKSVSYDRVVSQYLNDPSFEQYYNSSAQVPYLFDGDTFITYEDEDSIAAKASLASDYGLAGVGAWELSHDQGANLLSAAAHALR